MIEPKTIIAVLRNTGTGDRTILGALSDNPSPLYAYYFKSNDLGGKMVIEFLGITSNAKSNTIIGTHNFYIQSARLTDSSIELFVNSMLVSRSNYTGTRFNINGNGVV